jgi:hypothetical protein
MKQKITVFAATIAIGLGLAAWADTEFFPGPGDNETYPDVLVTLDLGVGAGTVSWTNTLGWTRMASASYAAPTAIASTVTVSVVRSAESVTDIIASIVSTNATSFRWSALTLNDVVVRYGDVVAITSSDSSTNGVAFLSLER